MNTIDIMRTVDIGSLRFAGAARQCPHCRAEDVRWFGSLRICASCRNVFHWRDVTPGSDDSLPLVG